MRNWFEWNGVRCTNYGIVATELPPITVPGERVKTAVVPGRAGNLTVPEGDSVYEVFTAKVKCYVRNSSDIITIAHWLRGSGIVTFANRPEGYYRARVSEPLEFEKILRGNEALSFEVTFECQPFLYLLLADQTFTFTGASCSVRGQGSVFAEPQIAVTGSGTFNLYVNDISVYIDGIDGTLVLDCDAGIAYKEVDGETVFAGTHVSLTDGAWPRLEANGALNLISWNAVSGSMESVTVRPNWRCL